MLDVASSDTQGSINLGVGTCTLIATDDTLTLRVEAADEAKLRRMQDMLAKRVETIGRRDGLKVAWQRTDTPEPVPAVAGTRHRSRLGTVALVGAAVVAVAAHIAAGGVLLSAPWVGWVADAVLALVIVKLAVVAVIGLRHHRGRR